jgi:hypothetical protein
MEVLQINPKAFSSIKRFITDLSDQFGEAYRPLALYSHLISKITPEHPEAMAKIVKLFADFSITNRDSIYSKDISGMVNTKISYSDKVYVDLSDIFELADNNTQKVMWVHILLISAMVDPTGKAKQVLSESPKKENVFMANVIDKIEGMVDADSDPMDAIGTMMKSGMVGNIMSDMTDGLKSGDFDIKGLMGSIQNIVGGFKPPSKGDDGESPPDLAKMMEGMMEGMMKGMPSGDGEDGPPDLAKMMEGMMKGLVSPSKDGASGDGAPDLAKMMEGMMKGLSGEGGPDLGKMLGGMMGGEGGGDLMSSVLKGEAPDLSTITNSSGVKLDEAGLPVPPNPDKGDPLKLIGQLMGAPKIPKSKPTKMTSL